ncbi:hypothetical protein C8Q74DRAFT_1220448 [Fomes fomentarius]|nr:hypothetical protein C8Q74DRAFT_1220448 [Fomes fomentarius]
MSIIILTAGGTPWCFCTLQIADRNIPRLQSELSATSKQLVVVERKLAEEKEADKRLKKELHCCMKQLEGAQCVVSDLEGKLASQMLHQEERELEQLARHRDLEAKFTGLQRHSGSCPNSHPARHRRLLEDG